MTIENQGVKAAHLEELAARMTEIDTRPIDGHLLGMQEKVAEALDHLKRAMFPYHFGKARARFVETEKRTYELMKAYDALDQTLELVCNSENRVRMACAELIRRQLESCGFTVNLSSLDYNSYLERLASGLYDLYVGEVKLTADMDLSLFFAPDGAAGYGLLPDSASAKAFYDWRAGAVETNTFAQVFLQDQPFVPICFRSGILYHAKELQMEGSVCENDLFSNLYTWSY